MVVPAGGSGSTAGPPSGETVVSAPKPRPSPVEAPKVPPSGSPVVSTASVSAAMPPAGASAPHRLQRGGLPGVAWPHRAQSMAVTGTWADYAVPGGKSKDKCPSRLPRRRLPILPCTRIALAEFRRRMRVLSSCDLPSWARARSAATTGRSWRARDTTSPSSREALTSTPSAAPVSRSAARRSATSSCARAPNRTLRRSVMSTWSSSRSRPTTTRPPSPRSCRSLGPSSTVLTLQNGVDSAAELAAAVGEDTVVGGTTYIATALAAPGVIEQTGTHRRIIFGEVFGALPRMTDRVRAIEATLAAADIQAQAVEDGRIPIWEKFIFLVALAGFTGAARLPIGPIWQDAWCRAQFLEGCPRSREGRPRRRRSGRRRRRRSDPVLRRGDSGDDALVAAD